MKLRNLILFSNGNVAAFDEKGEQIPALQVPVHQVVCKEAERLGIDPLGATFETEDGAWNIAKDSAGNWVRELKTDWLE